MQVVHQSFPRKVCAKHMFECGSGFSFLSEPNQVQESRNRSWTELDKPSVLFCHAGMHSVNDYVETIKNIYLYFFFISVVTHIPIKNCSFIQAVTTTTEPNPRPLTVNTFCLNPVQSMGQTNTALLSEVTWLWICPLQRLKWRTGVSPVCTSKWFIVPFSITVSQSCYSFAKQHRNTEWGEVMQVYCKILRNVGDLDMKWWLAGAGDWWVCKLAWKLRAGWQADRQVGKWETGKTGDDPGADEKQVSTQTTEDRISRESLVGLKVYLPWTTE